VLLPVARPPFPVSDVSVAPSSPPRLVTSARSGPLTLHERVRLLAVLPMSFDECLVSVFPVNRAGLEFDQRIGTDLFSTSPFRRRVKDIPLWRVLALELIVLVHHLSVEGANAASLIGALNESAPGDLKLRFAAVGNDVAQLQGRAEAYPELRGLVGSEQQSMA
jgi:hypothetical protein